jgi:dihydrodipicolinate synthase/N-acetylneuraminate lyase
VKFQSIYPPAVAAYAPGGSIDKKAYVDVLEALIEAKVNVLGTALSRRRHGMTIPCLSRSRRKS